MPPIGLFTVCLDNIDSGQLKKMMNHFNLLEYQGMTWWYLNRELILKWVSWLTADIQNIYFLMSPVTHRSLFLWVPEHWNEFQHWWFYSLEILQWVSRCRWLVADGYLFNFSFNTLRPRQMDVISQTTFSSAFSWMKMFELRLKCHWSLFLRVQLTIFQHWFR